MKESPRRSAKSLALLFSACMLCGLCAAECSSCSRGSTANGGFPSDRGSNVTVYLAPGFDPVGGLADLLRGQTLLIDRFEDLLHTTPKTVDDSVMFLSNFEELVRNQAVLLSEFGDILKSRWRSLSRQEQHTFLCSFEDLIDRQVVLLTGFANLSEEDWNRFDSKNKTKFLSSFEDLLRRQSDLIKSYEDLYRITYGGITIEKSVDKTVVHRGETVRYTYEITNWFGNESITDVSIFDNVLGPIVSNITLGPSETRYFSKSAVISGDTCNKARAFGKTPENATISEESQMVCVRFVRVSKNYGSIKSGKQTTISFGADLHDDANSVEIVKSQRANSSALRESYNIEHIETGDQTTISLGTTGAKNYFRIVTSQD
ncbi:Uncharacterised protein [uncultured archaeon]|nr:Uncharacterised protein [uncultured archaeon]